MAKLTVYVDNQASRVYRITDKIMIGRDASNDIQVIDVKVSRRHSCVEKRKGYHILKDLGSRNGTFLNDVQIKESELNPGDRIRVGDTEIVFAEEPLLDAQEEIGLENLDEDSSSQMKILDHTFEISGLAKLAEEKATKPRLKQTLEKLTTLFEVGQILNTANNSQEMMNSILDQITRVIKSDRSYLMLVDSKTGEMTESAIRTTTEDVGTPRISTTILNQVLEKGISILSPDAFQDERFKGAESIFLHSIRSAMCVPLKSREKVLGVIHVDTKGAFDIFSEEDLKMLTAIGISAGTAMENMQLYEHQKHLFLSTVKCLVATIEASDNYTGGHSVRVAEFAKTMAVCMGLPEDEVEQVELAAFLHDVGKIGIPERILNKSSAFNEEEIKIMRSHPAAGADILSKIDGMEEIADVVRHHHERFDGKGYPDGLKGSEIPLGARILCVADTIDAITTNRSYRKKRTFDVALSELVRCSGAQFDPEIIKVLKKCSDALPMAAAN